MAESFPIPFGRYTLVERLAMGGMAELFLATVPGEHGFQKRLVIKRLLPHLAREPVYTAMFIDEAKLTAALVHPKIAQTHELGRFDNDLFIAMEFVDGIDVLALLREHAWLRKRIPVEQAVWICHEVLDALDFAHNLTDENGSLGIVHRDISPSNVLLSRRGDVKLVDFGIARASSAGRHHRTKSGTLKGKYGYMSPEQVTEQAVDGRSDLFSVGVVLAEMLCGRRLFAAAAEIDVLLMVRDARLTRLDQFGGHIPPTLDEILRRTLRKDPDERWSSAADLRDALADWLFQERQRVGPKQIAELVEAFHDTAWRRRRETMAKAAAVVDAAGSAALDPGDQLSTPDPASPEMPSPSDGQARLPLALADLDPGAAAVDTGLILAPDGYRRRRPASTDGLPIIAIESAPDPTFFEPDLDVHGAAEIAVSLAPEHLVDTGPVAMAEDSVDLDLDDLTDPPPSMPDLEFEPPGARPLWSPPPVDPAFARQAAVEAKRSPGTESRLRRAGSNALPPQRGHDSDPHLQATRIPGSEPRLPAPRAPDAGPGYEPVGRSRSSPTLDPYRRADPPQTARGPADRTSSPGQDRARTTPGADARAPSVARPTTTPPFGEAPSFAGRPVPALGTSPQALDDDDLGLGPAGPRPSDQRPSGPAAPRPATPSLRSSRLETEPAARGSNPDLLPPNLDAPVPPPSRGGPATGRGERMSQPIMSAAARNRAMSTSPPPGARSGSRANPPPPVDPAAPTRRQTSRPTPSGRAFLGDELDALASDIDAAVQQLQVPIHIDDDSGAPIESAPSRANTRSGDWQPTDFDDTSGSGGRPRVVRAPVVEEGTRTQRASEPPTGELGPPTARGDFAQTPPMTVLFRLAAAGATGLLTASVGGIRKEIYVRGGIAEYVTSNMASELLGNYLVARGALSPGELAMALAMMPHYGGKLGDTLVGLGLLKPLEVFRYLNHQVREKLIDVCTWTKGGYAWYEGRTNQRNAFPIDLNQFEVLGAGAMDVRDDVIAAWMQQHAAHVVLRVRARPTIELERFEIPGLAALYERTDGERTIGELITESLDPGHQRRVARMLRLLTQCELVRMPS